MKTGAKDCLLCTALVVPVIVVVLLVSQPHFAVAGSFVLPGQENEQVQVLQHRLSELGFFEARVTGFYDQETTQSVKKFQEAADLRVDGVAGGRTLSALKVAEGRTEEFPTLQIYMNGPEVIYLQYILFEMGYLSVEPTGFFRSLTQQAVREFQKKRDLEADGVVGRRTWQALRKEMLFYAGLGEEDEDLLARLIYAEARGETLKGQIAVGAVVLNRVASPHFPNSIKEVVFQPSQFEPASKGSLNGADDNAHIAARRALAGEDPTQGALYFYSPSILEERGRKDRLQWFETESTPTIKIGTHTFSVPNH